MATIQIPVPLTTPDASGNGYAAMVSTANIREVVAAFTKSVDGDWWGIVKVPQDYVSTPKIVLSLAANATSGSARVQVSTKPIANAASYDAALTAETAVDQTMPATAYQRTDVTVTLSTTPAAGNDLLVKIRRVGSNVADTLAVDLLLLTVAFQYSTV